MWICNLIAELELFIFASLMPLTVLHQPFEYPEYIQFYTIQVRAGDCVSAVVYLSSWYLSVLYLVGGTNLSQTDFLGSFCIKGCLSGQSAGEALRSQ